MKVTTDYLRPYRGQCMQTLLDAGDWLPEKLDAPVYGHATVVPFLDYEQPGMAGVLDSEGCFIEGSKYRSSDEAVEYESAAQPEYRDLKVVYLGHYNPHWGHFLSDSSIRMWYALEEDPTVDAYAFSCKADETAFPSGNLLEMLELLGIAEKTLMLTCPTTFREVVIPERSYERDYRQGRISMSPLWRRTFEAISERALAGAGIAAHQCSERLYLSRARYAKARKNCIGRELLDDFFKRNGYQAVYPEQTSLTELIVRMAQASSVASESGAVSINLLFAPRGVEHIEMERLVFNDLVFLAVDMARGGPVVHIDCSHALRPVPIGAGPFLFAYTEQFARFVADRGLEEPDARFRSRGHLKGCLGEFVRAYRRSYGYSEALPWHDWLFDYGLFAEAHRDARRDFAPWISRFGSLEGPAGGIIYRIKEKLLSLVGRR